MVDHVRRSFSEILQELTWLEDSTKKVAQEKVCTSTRLLLVLFCDADAGDATVSTLYRRRRRRIHHHHCRHSNRHRRSQDSVWGLHFFPKTLTTFF